MGFEKSEYIKSLIDDYIKPKPFISQYLYSTADPPDLHKKNLGEILGFPDGYFSETGKRILEYLETEEDNQSSKSYLDFKKKVLAFIFIQDNFRELIYPGIKDYLKEPFRIWYFYFESKYIFNELINCWLNGLYISARQNLRLFLEFSLMQNYFYRNSIENSSLSLLNKYFIDGNPPAQNILVNKSIPKDNFSKPIKKMISDVYKNLSRNSSHSYNPEFSPRLFSQFPSVHLEGIHFYFHIDIILRVVLWIYYSNFPMLFHPVDYIKKFGFNWPVGLFVDKFTSSIIKLSLSDEDYKLFYNYTMSSAEVDAYLDFYNSQNDLSEDEIIKTFHEDYKFKSILDTKIKGLSTIRGIREVLALKKPEAFSKEELEKIPENLNHFSLTNWRKIYKKKE